MPKDQREKYMALAERQGTTLGTTPRLIYILMFFDDFIPVYYIRKEMKKPLKQWKPNVFNGF